MYPLAYPDDMVLLIEEEGKIKNMLEKLDRYVDGKNLVINVEKTKMRCRKGGRREKKMEWRWKEKRIEKVKEFQYLRYWIKRNGSQETQVRERE